MARKKRKKSRRSFDSKRLMQRSKKSRQRTRQGTSVIKPNVEFTRYSPKDGRHAVDILPYIAGKNDEYPGDPQYTFEYWVHMNVGPSNAWIICPQETFGEACPICEHRARLREKSPESDKYKQFFPRRRNLYNLVSYDRGDDRKKVLLLDVSWHRFEKFVAKKAERVNRRTGKVREIAFSSPVKKEGRTITWEIEKAKSKNDYDEWLDFDFEKRDYDISESLLDDCLVLDEIVVILDYEKIEELFYAGKSSKREDVDDDDEDIDDEEDDDEYEEDEDDEDDEDEEDEDDEDDDKPSYTKKQIKKMNFKKLKRLIKKEELDVDPDDYEEDDDDDLEDMQNDIMEELDL